MKIKRVEYSALVNLGNYSNERISFTADLTDGETPETAIVQLRTKAQECALPNMDTTISDIYKAQKELKDLERKLVKARGEWNATAEFLRAQGIKTDASDMPQFNRLLAGLSEESVEVTEAEIEEDDRF